MTEEEYEALLFKQDQQRIEQNCTPKKGAFQRGSSKPTRVPKNTSKKRSGHSARINIKTVRPSAVVPDCA
ncbi:MAG: hypothetical protein WAN11_26255 [Syntrophobacteraceae bacterium]